jgi:hypothetical protein
LLEQQHCTTIATVAMHASSSSGMARSVPTPKIVEGNAGIVAFDENPIAPNKSPTEKRFATAPGPEVA